MDRTKSRSNSLTQRTTDTLRQMIVDGVLNLGETLSESKVARLLGVSRTPVREAFARLEIEGLVFSQPQRSTRVFLLGPRDVDDICDVRCGLEKMALALAMKGDRRELFSLLSDATKRMTQAIDKSDISEYLRVDSQFHQAVFDSADNVFLNDAYQTIATKMAALRTRMATRPDYLRKGLSEHWRLCELVNSGDLDGALVVLEEHVSRKEDSFWHLNDGLAEAEVAPDKANHRTGVTAAARKTPTQFDRQNRILASALMATKPRESRSEIGIPDDITIGDLSSPRHHRTVTESDARANAIDEIKPNKKSLDLKRRGRPRIHADGAARKRAWAARERAKKKAERLASGKMKKRGRPRKYATQTERQKAYEKRRRQSRTAV